MGSRLRFVEPVMMRSYRWLLMLYPAEFRHDYARELCLVLKDSLHGQGSRLARFSVWMHAVLGVLKEAPKEQMHTMWNDLRYAFRILRKEKLPTAAAIATMALGIGSATVVFSLANGLLVRPLPYGDAQRLVAVEEFHPLQPAASMGVAFPNYQDFRERTRLLEDVAVYTEGLATVRGEGEAERVPAGFVSDGIFGVLGVRPILGRIITPEEDLPNGPRVVVLGEDLWRRRYGSDPNVLGRTLQLGTNQYTVVGVMPSSFRFPQRAELWIPLQLSPQRSTRTDHFLSGIARMKSGVSVKQASDDLEALMRQLNRENPATDNGFTARAVSIRTFVAGDYRPAVLTLVAGVSFLLLIACANITNLLLMKASARGREMAVRTALGAPRSRLVRQLMTESVVLGLAGGLAGVGLAYAALPALLALIPVELPHWMSFEIDRNVLAVALGLSFATSVMFGLVPAFASSRVDLTGSLKEGAHAVSAGTRRNRLRHALVVVEVGLSLALLVGGGLLLRSFLALTNQPLGFETTNILTLQIAWPDTRYPRGPEARALIQQLHGAISTLPGVRSVSFASSVPLAGRWGRSLTAEGHPVLALKDAPMINHTVAWPGYFGTLGIPLLEGRDFAESDWDNPLVTIVDESLARRYWPNESAIGKRVRFGPPENNEPWHTIIGVAAYNRNQFLDSRGRWNVYIPFSRNFSGGSVVVRTEGVPDRTVQSVRRRIVEHDRDIAVSLIASLDHIVTQVSWRERFFAILFSVFGGFALLLAAVGLYGVLAYAVSLRRHEIGIRMALGATRADIRAMVLRQGLWLTTAGLAAGAAAALVLARLLTEQLYQVNPQDPWTYLGVTLVLAIAAMLAALGPARRATRIAPMAVLRNE